MTEFEKGMRAAGKLAARTLEHVSKFIAIGITTNELDKITEDYIRLHGALPAPLGYKGYPKSICTSINGILCHGVPDNTKLKEGDIINVDVTVLLNGYHGDTSATYPVGQISESADKLIKVAHGAMMAGIAMVRPYGTVGDIGFGTSQYVKKNGLFVASQIGGHGIGKGFHEEPFVPSIAAFGTGQKLMPGKCITVEPIVLEKDVPYYDQPIENSQVFIYTTGNETLAAQFEHTVLITQSGYDILTLP